MSAEELPLLGDERDDEPLVTILFEVLHTARKPERHGVRSARFLDHRVRVHDERLGRGLRQPGAPAARVAVQGANLRHVVGEHEGAAEVRPSPIVDDPEVAIRHEDERPPDDLGELVEVDRGVAHVPFPDAIEEPVKTDEDLGLAWVEELELRGLRQGGRRAGDDLAETPNLARPQLERAPRMDAPEAGRVEEGRVEGGVARLEQKRGALEPLGHEAVRAVRAAVHRTHGLPSAASTQRGKHRVEERARNLGVILRLEVPDLPERRSACVHQARVHDRCGARHEPAIALDAEELHGAVASECALPGKLGFEWLPQRLYETWLVATDRDPEIDRLADSLRPDAHNLDRCHRPEHSSQSDYARRRSMPRTLRYRDRETDEILIERVFGDGALDFLYGHPARRALTDRVLTSRIVNRLYGLLQRAGASRSRIPSFVADLGIDASEAELPLESYASLDHFFTRRLKHGARPIDLDPAHLVSPADGRALAWQRLDGDCLAVKGSRLSVRDLLADNALAAELAASSALVVRLAPADYHRFHFPDGGVAGPPRSTGTRLHSVHPIALEAGAPSFANHRTITRLESDGFGPIAIVDVGALLVGTIVETYRPGRVARGEEKGYFRFGGSTVVIVARADRVAFDDDLLAATAAGLESRVRMGTRVGRRRR